MGFEFTVKIRQAQDVAFDAMADARNEVHWNSAVSASELVTAAPVGPGSRFRTVNRGKPYDAVITTYDKPAKLAFEVTGKQMDITASFDFQEGSEATPLTARFDMRPKGIMKLVFPLLKPMISKDLPKQGQSFKSFCENSRP